MSAIDHCLNTLDDKIIQGVSTGTARAELDELRADRERLEGCIALIDAGILYHRLRRGAGPITRKEIDDALDSRAECVRNKDAAMKD